ncbi:sigma-70 family RNA polymerase sigma factor [Streptomyces sp. NPDC054904]|uniref:sigma-70 family RNA polymerase sigma factor n=1 Tax=Streptomyces sp. Isolate_45 TaxID=2950111 RepID=UPI002481D3F7|nr:sigma-70 family RNA polymerase sigma factor [Streptomyces sp. Isolate_45]MDA5284027.1 sigma-70 family RNA polymerase sigma factor [Streptomyces sp. Isolate_45]
MEGESHPHPSPRPPARPRPEALTEQQAERMLTEMNEVIRAGEEMRKLRSEMIKLFVGLGWTQDKIARLTDMSQPAVSKQVTKYATGEPGPAMGLDLDQGDAPWLEGRLWGLAEEISEVFEGARCTRHVNAIARGRKRFTPQGVDELRRLLEEDLALHGQESTGPHRAAYDEIARGLDVPSGAASPGAASVRRALARQVQRDRLRNGD